MCKVSVTEVIILVDEVKLNSYHFEHIKVP